MIDLKEIKKEYISKDKITALNSISFTLPTIGLVGISGKSGSGKTTLLNILTGIVKPSEGYIVYDGVDSRSLSENDYENLRKDYFGIVFQGNYLYENLSVSENLSVVNFIKNNCHADASGIIKKLDISNLLDKKIHELSGGEKQKVAIARALYKDCKVLIVDEPTSSLDEENAKSIFSLLKEISKEKLVIVVSHDKDELLNISDLFVELSYGKIVKMISNKICLDNNENIISSNNELSKKSFLYLLKLISKGNVFRKLFHFVFLILSITISIISFSCVFVNREEYFYDYLEKTEIPYYLVLDNEQKVDLSDFGYSDYNYYKLNKWITTSDYDVVEYENSKYGAEIFRNVSIIDTPKNTIKITDFTAEMLKSYGVLKKTNIIGESIKIKNKYYVINDILSTDYELININDNLNAYKYYRENILTTLFVNKEDAFEILDKNPIVIDSEGYSFKVDEIGNYNLVDSSALLEGSNIPTRENEVIVSNSFLYHYYNLKEDFNGDYKEFLNTNITVQINGLNRNVKVVGINYSNPIIICSYNLFIDICLNLEENPFKYKERGFILNQSIIVFFHRAMMENL